MAPTKKHRYPGINFYSKEDARIFCGRAEDSQKLFTRVMLNQTVVLHGESGTGKSSLVQAGLLPLIEKYNVEMQAAGKPVCVPVTIRFDAVEPLQQDENKIVTDPAVLVKQTLRIINEQNPFKYEHLPYIDKKEGSFWYTAKLFEKNNCSLLLIFDQFEALQGYDYAQVTNLVNELSGLFSGVMPPTIYSEYDQQTESLTNAKTFSATERKTYSDDISFLEKALSAKALFIVREDKLGTMSLLSDHFPDILKNDFLLYRLNKKNAAKAIIEPALLEGDFQSAPFSYEEDAVDYLLQNLADQSTSLYDPIQLQIVCSSIEQNIADKKNLVKKEDIPSVGDIIRDFYNEIWSGIKTTFKFPDDAFETKRRSMIKELVVKDSRNLVLENLLINPASKEDREIIRTLTDKGLLRRIPSGNDTYYQLSHDRLRAPLTQDLKELQAKEEMQEEMKVQRAKNKNKRIWFLGIGTILLAIACTVAIVIYFRASKEERIAEQKKYLLISTALKRDADPTMSYLVSRDLLQKRPGFEMIHDFLKPFDTAGYVYLNAILPSESDVVFCGMSSDTELVISETEHRSSWNINNGFMTERKKLSTLPLKRIYTKAGWRDVYYYHDSIILKNKEGKTIVQVKANISNASNIAISPDDQYLLMNEMLYHNGKAVSSVKSTITRTPVTEKKEYWQTAASFLSNFRVAVAYENGEVIIYDIGKKGTNSVDSVWQISTGKGDNAEDNRIGAMVVDNEGRHLFISNSRNEIEIYEKISEPFDGAKPDSFFRKKTELRGHAGPVNSLAVSTDGRLLLSGSSDFTAILWNLETMQKETVLKGPNATEIVFVRFLRGGHMVTVSDENIVYLWQRDRPGNLYDKGLLYRYSAFNYKIWGLDENKDGKPRDTASTISLYCNILNYLLNMPLHNDYPEDEVYNNSIRESVSEIKALYSSLHVRKDYQEKIPVVNASLLDHHYYKLLYAASSLQNQNQPEIDLDILKIQREIAAWELHYRDKSGSFLPLNSTLNRLEIFVKRYLDGKQEYRDGYRMIRYCKDSLLDPLVKKFGPNKNLDTINAEINVAHIKYYLYNGDIEHAEKTIKELHEIRSYNTDCRIFSVAASLVAGRYGEAVALYHQCLANDPKKNNRKEAKLLYVLLTRLTEKQRISTDDFQKFNNEFPGLAL